MIFYVLLLVLLCIAVYTDVRQRLIPNWLVLLVLALGLVHVGLDFERAPDYFLSFIVGLIVWGGLFKTKLVGGGDAKLMMALSLFVLPINLLTFYLCVLIVGGLQAGLWMLLKKDKHMPYGVAIAAGSVLFYFL